MVLFMEKKFIDFLNEDFLETKDFDVSSFIEGLDCNLLMEVLKAKGLLPLSQSSLFFHILQICLIANLLKLLILCNNLLL